MSFNVPEGIGLSVIPASAAQTVLTADYPLLSAAELDVWRLRAGALTLLTLTTDYAIAGVLEPAGFTVTLGAGALAGDVYALARDTAAARVDDRFSTAGDFTGSAVNRALDRLMLLLQERARDDARSVRAPFTDGEDVDLVLPSKVVGAGNLIERADDGTIRNDRSFDDMVAAATAALADALDTITDAGNSQVARVTGEGNTQDARIVDEGDTQVGLVESAGTTAVEAVEAVADELVALAAIFDTSRRRWVFGQEMAWLIRNGAHRMGAAIGRNGLFYANHAIRTGPAANGLTFVRAADGFYDINFGDTPNELPLGAGAKAVSTRLRSFGEQWASLLIRGRNGRVVGAIGADGTFSPTKLSLAAMRGVVPSRDSVHAGDSLTEGAGSTAGNDYPSVYARLRGTAALNLGIFGQKSTQALARLGGIVLGFTLDDGVIDAGPNTVTHLNGVALAGMATVQDPDYRLLWTADNTTRTIKGSLCGVYGTLTGTASGGPPSTSIACSFTPASAPANPIPCPAGSPFLVDVSAYVGKTIWIEVGRNNFYAVDLICAEIATTVAFFQSMGILVHIGILTTINGANANELPGGGALAQILTLNNRLISTWPFNTLDQRRGLIDRGLEIAGLTPTAIDIVDRGLDIIPTKLRWLLGTGTLGTTINTSATTFAVTVGTGAVGPGTVLTIGAERITVISMSGSTVTNCTRHDLGTSPASHTSGDAYEVRDSVHLNDDGYFAKGFLCDEFSTLRGW